MKFVQRNNRILFKVKNIILLTNLLIITSGISNNVFAQNYIVPAANDLESHLSTDSNLKNVYLKKVKLASGQKIIKIGNLDSFYDNMIVPFNNIYSVDLNCELQDQLKTEFSTPKQTTFTGGQIIVLDNEPIVENDVNKNSETTSDKLTKPAVAISGTFKSFLTIHFISEKNSCSSSKDLLKNCLSWDKYQTQPHFKNVIAEFESKESASKAMTQCQEYAVKLNKSISTVAQKIQIKSTLMSDLVEEDSQLMTPANESATPVKHYQKNWDPDTSKPEYNNLVTCRALKHMQQLQKYTGENYYESLGKLKFTFSARQKEKVNGFENNIGTILKISTEKGPDGAIPYVDFDINAAPNYYVDTQIFQYYSKDFPMESKEIKGDSSKANTLAFPFAIDVLRFDKNNKILYRSIIDFKRNHVWVEEFSELNYNSMAEILASTFWAKQQKNWYDLKNNKYIRANPVRIDKCNL